MMIFGGFFNELASEVLKTAALVPSLSTIFHNPVLIIL
jgi:hypothetical protein